MKNLLLVDDEKNFLLSLTDMFLQYGEEYHVHKAFNGREAIDILAARPIDLVVTDIKMPEVDGFGLLAHMSSKHPNIPVIVMTAFSSPDVADRLDTLGVFQYIEKPIDFDHLLGKVRNSLAKGSRGHVRGVSLASFLQLIGLDGKTCTLKVNSQGRTGVIYFQQGEIFDAVTDTATGQDAALDVVGWDPVEIEIEEVCRKTKKAIDAPLGFILIEGARRKDESPAAPIPPKEPQRPEPDSFAEQPQATARVHGALTPEAQKSIDLLVQSIQAIGSIHGMIVARRDGSFLAHRNINKQTAVYLVRMALETEAMRPGFQKQAVQYLTIQHDPEKRFVVLAGSQIIVGLETDCSDAPATIASNLGPAVRRAVAV